MGAMAKKQKRILIVEDERAMAKALELKLSRSGYEAKAVFNGREALEALRSDGYALVLLDLVMPQMDGFAVLNQMKAEGIKTPVIVASNLSQEEDIKKAKSLGVKDYFVKSNTPISDVVKHINKVLKA